MSRQHSALTSAIKLGADQLCVQIGSFLRNVILARLISPDDFGIATILILAFALVDMISNVAVETLIVQADYGDSVEFQESAHLFQACRGVLNSVILFAVADPASRLFGVTEAKWAFLTMSALPLIKGFTHTDAMRLKRHWVFGPTITVSISTATIATLATMPLAVWLRSYSAIVWTLLIQVTVSTVASHLVADRPYRWKWTRAYFARILAFGWPLLVNGFLMYLIFQGDRLVIALSSQLFPRSSYTHTDLAAYSVAVSCILIPGSFVAEISHSLFLPLLSQAQRVKSSFERVYALSAQALCLFAAGISVPLIIAGGWLIAYVFGSEYASSRGVMGWLAAMIALRIIRMAPTLASVALGDTKNGMIPNLARTVALAAVVAITAVGYGLEWIAACGFAGELLALGVCVWRLYAVHDVKLGLCLVPGAIAFVGIFMAALVHFIAPADLSAVGMLFSSAAVIALVATVMVGSSHRLRRDVRALMGLNGSFAANRPSP